MRTKRIVGPRTSIQTYTDKKVDRISSMQQAKTSSGIVLFVKELLFILKLRIKLKNPFQKLWRNFTTKSISNNTLKLFL